MLSRKDATNQAAREDSVTETQADAAKAYYWQQLRRTRSGLERSIYKASAENSAQGFTGPWRATKGTTQRSVAEATRCHNPGGEGTGRMACEYGTDTANFTFE